MDFDPKVMKELYDIFRAELEEQSRLIVDSLIAIESNSQGEEEKKQCIESMFRAAHTIKGASRSLGINDIGTIAHELESIFALIKNASVDISPEMVSVCFEAVDIMKVILDSTESGNKAGYDMASIIDKLQQKHTNIKKISLEAKGLSSEKENDQVQVSSPPVISPSQSVRVSVRSLDKISSLIDDINECKLNLNDYHKNLTSFIYIHDQFRRSFNEMMRAVIREFGGEVPESINKLYIENQDSLVDQNDMLTDYSVNFRQNLYRFNILNTLLQDEVKLARLVPASILFGMMPRVVRELAKELGKQVDLVIQGEEIQLDKMVLEHIKDPVIQILRNAIDHGLESKQDREKNGKSEDGRIEIKIQDQGGRIQIDISDDGVGIDADIIGNIALNRNIVSKETLQDMNDAEKLNLIFEPGITTRTTATSISGRGVGLDVVKTNITRVNGQVRVRSEVGRGTTFTMILPVSLSSERGVLVQCMGHKLVIPCSIVQRIMRIEKSEIKDVAGSQVLMINKIPVRVCVLANLLSISEGTSITDNEKLHVVLIKNNMITIALLVDEVLGEREIVVKQVQAPMSNIPCIAGATLLEGNRIGIVLNPSDIFTKASEYSNDEKIKFIETKSLSPSRINVLVVDDSITTRTLQKNILESNNFNVTIAVNGRDAWELVQNKKFAIVISDVDMPIMNGLQLTEKIKSNPQYNQIPVIIVTSMGSDAEKKRGLDAGADAYIVKSQFESGILIDLIKQLVRV